MCVCGAASQRPGRSRCVGAVQQVNDMRRVGVRCCSKSKNSRQQVLCAAGGRRPEGSKRSVQEHLNISVSQNRTACRDRTCQTKDGSPKQTYHVYQANLNKQTYRANLLSNTDGWACSCTS
eukprot:340450-Chlamydomonas_euryale.AAC.1